MKTCPFYDPVAGLKSISQKLNNQIKAHMTVHLEVSWKCTAQTLPLLKDIEVLMSYFGKTMDWLLRSEYYPKKPIQIMFELLNASLKLCNR